MQPKIIKKESLTPSVWDGGKTFEYFIYPKGARYSTRIFDFRISHVTSFYHLANIKQAIEMTTTLPKNKGQLFS